MNSCKLLLLTVLLSFVPEVKGTEARDGLPFRLIPVRIIDPFLKGMEEFAEENPDINVSKIKIANGLYSLKFNICALDTLKLNSSDRETYRNRIRLLQIKLFRETVKECMSESNLRELDPVALLQLVETFSDQFKYNVLHSPNKPIDEEMYVGFYKRTIEDLGMPELANDFVRYLMRVSLHNVDVQDDYWGLLHREILMLLAVTSFNGNSEMDFIIKQLNSLDDDMYLSALNEAFSTLLFKGSRRMVNNLALERVKKLYEGLRSGTIQSRPKGSRSSFVVMLGLLWVMDSNGLLSERQIEEGLKQVEAKCVTALTDAEYPISEDRPTKFSALVNYIIYNKKTSAMLSEGLKRMVLNIIFNPDLRSIHIQDRGLLVDSFLIPYNTQNGMTDLDSMIPPLGAGATDYAMKLMKEHFRDEDGVCLLRAVTMFEENEEAQKMLARSISNYWDSDRKTSTYCTVLMMRNFFSYVPGNGNHLEADELEKYRKYIKTNYERLFKYHAESGRMRRQLILSTGGWHMDAYILFHTGLITGQNFLPNYILGKSKFPSSFELREGYDKFLKWWEKNKANPRYRFAWDKAE